MTSLTSPRNKGFGVASPVDKNRGYAQDLNDLVATGSSDLAGQGLKSSTVEAIRRFVGYLKANPIIPGDFIPVGGRSNTELTRPPGRTR